MQPSQDYHGEHEPLMESKPSKYLGVGKMMVAMVMMITIEVEVDGDGLVFRLGQDHSVADCKFTVSPTILP